eukprot:s1314_g17.t2
MAPTPETSDSSVLPDRPGLLNEQFKVHSYDGGAFKSKAQYDIKNSLVPIIEPFHCSGNGTKFNLVLKCSEDFTLTHFYVSGPGPRCTEPIKSGLVWVLEHAPDVERLKKYDSMRSEELLEIVKGLRTYSSSEQAGSVPDPCLYFTTDSTTREVELELPKWKEGKFLVVKFLDTHNNAHNGQRNIDVGIIGMIGYTGRFAKQQIPLGPWMKRSVRQVWVHPSELKSMFSSSGWVCDGRDFTGGCRSGSGCSDFNGTNFLETGRALGGTAGTARALQKLRALIEDESTRRYLRGALKQLGGAMDALQRIHVHPKVAFAGSLYLDCVQGEDGSCGVYLQDPRTPAGMAEVPDVLRQRLGWGHLHRLHVAPGTLLLYPAWLQHAALTPRMFEATAAANRSRAVISFLVAVQMQEKGDKLKRAATR